MAAAGEEVTSGLPFQSGTVSPAGHGAGGSVGASLLVKLGPQQREWSRPHSSKLEPCAWSLLELFCRPRERLVRLLHLPGWSGLLLKEVGAFSLVPPLESSCRPEADLPRDLPGVAWSSPPLRLEHLAWLRLPNPDSSCRTFSSFSSPSRPPSGSSSSAPVPSSPRRARKIRNQQLDFFRGLVLRALVIC